jgi:ribonuclease HIII
MLKGVGFEAVWEQFLYMAIFAVVTLGPRAYNRLYASMRNVNQMLAWGHARVIENLLEQVPGCPRAVS